MNKDSLIYGLFFGAIPFLIVVSKWRIDHLKFRKMESLYKKQLHCFTEIEEQKKEQKQKHLKNDAEQGDSIEYRLMNILMKDNRLRVRKICITGGPCAGKTTGLNYLAEKLKERGFSVYIVPEAATTLFMGGGMLDLDNYSAEGKMTFQMNLLNLQMKLEHCFNVLAMLCPPNKTPVMLCDRGLMDGKAYMDQNEWYEMIGKYNLEEVKLRDERYDAVVHMVTAADSTDCYSTLNNKARHETQQQALEMDHKTQSAWSGHPNLIKIDNHSVKSFNDKLDWLLREVLRILGHPIPQKEIGKTRQFYLEKDMKFENIQDEHQIIEIKKTYLIPKYKNCSLVLLQRKHEGRQQLYIKEKLFENDTMVKANIIKLDKNDFELFKQIKDPNYYEISIKKVCFTYEGQYIVVNEYVGSCQVIKIKNCKENQQIKFPPYVDQQGMEESNEKITARLFAKRFKNELGFQHRSNSDKYKFRKLSFTDDINEQAIKQDLEGFNLDQKGSDKNNQVPQPQQK
ncbi:unnamed protein product (macronuclear) [Paramecium tetraurelia]|uniref:NadR/Ttd14 AAA domain-containing protein n=1 Tax=Paramecium tetraurelia TaxID=5888 RepID=A0DH89_PARTE|nr:uncharacterized protein GSPATT00016792001 [Paramecium tetraurelia]CAK82406.1 unnamed protein product [Paramecium tetraurelia]|eukprot:XP_001449803.1 hypothetical protein (macronuclear) [Paramecium tetraurelia strain d4-2]